MSKVAYSLPFPQIFAFRQNAIRPNQVKTQMLCFTQRQLLDYFWLPKQVLITTSISLSPSVSGDEISCPALTSSNSTTIDALSGITDEKQLVCFSRGAVYNNGRAVGNAAFGVPTWPNASDVYYDASSDLYYWDPRINISLPNIYIGDGVNTTGNAGGSIYSSTNAFSANLPNTASNGGTAAGDVVANGAGFTVSVNNWTVSCTLFGNMAIQWNNPDVFQDFTLNSIACVASLTVSASTLWTYS